MGANKYSLRISPLFEDDLNEIVDYIVSKLINPSVALTLVDNVEEAILKRLDFPESFEKYKSLKDRKYPYYRIYVSHYVVIEDIMEVRRIIYNKKNIAGEL